MRPVFTYNALFSLEAIGREHARRVDKFSKF